MPADAVACGAVIATLPYFFGQPAGIADCAAAVRSQRGLVAVDNSDAVIGFLTHRSHHAGSTEITWMAVRQNERRHGAGRQLLDVLGVIWVTAPKWPRIHPLNAC